MEFIEGMCKSRFIMENRITNRTRRWRSGPQPKVPEELRTKTISLRLTPAEHAELVARAKEHNMPVGRYCHQGVMKQKIAAPIPETNQKQWAYLGKIASSITILVRIAARRENFFIKPEDSVVLRMILQELRRIRMLLITGSTRLFEGDDNEG